MGAGVQRGSRCSKGEQVFKGGAGVGGINDLKHWLEGDRSMYFLPLMHDIKAASSILTRLTSL